jgi:hypothetical protein
MRVVVSGSRDWTDAALVYATMDDLHARYGIELVVHGEQRGLDLLVKQWAMERGLPVFGCPYPPAYGKQGGGIRNGWLLDFGTPNLVVAFPMKDSRGTWNMVTQAKQRGLNIRLIQDHQHD